MTAARRPQRWWRMRDVGSHPARRKHARLSDDGNPLPYAYPYTYTRCGGYDDAVPNKTIYVADGDLPLFDRAQELTGGNLSATITRALRRLVELEEGKLEGYEEITVRVGPGAGRRQRFIGVLLAELGRSTKDRVEQFRVYRGRTGKYVVHVQRSAETLWTAGADGTAHGWRKHFSSDQQWGSTAPTATLEVVDSLDELRVKIPAELYDLVTAAIDQPVIEDLDI